MTHISDIADRLGREAEAVCRYYLSNGKKSGHTWSVGDVRNTPGQSMQVRLYSSSSGVAGKWIDFATGEHGDLLDVIKLSLGLADMKIAVDEARRFLVLPRPAFLDSKSLHHDDAPADGRRSAFVRLWRMSLSLPGSLAETYLKSRGIVVAGGTPALRFHPRCFLHSSDGKQQLPAMIAAFTNGKGVLTGVHRTYLDAEGARKATIEHPRKALGRLLSSSVRFGPKSSVQLAGEGIETVLSLHALLPSLTLHAAGSSAHLPSIPFDRHLRRLYIAYDNDEAGESASGRLLERAVKSGIETILLMPQLGDFNDDLTTFGTDHLRSRLNMMLHQDDRRRLSPA
ncbi:toprim domain-containing protein [uncultured Bartonella sp.]|uniref:DUF7146 domain-containing protein n=1 Tax=uncultured Bartonella sp. TaxID=104108 RepID=UPI002614CA1C|nr:toprim domain-containing protein [uncultured Bartonella sp.]